MVSLSNHERSSFDRLRTSDDGISVKKTYVRVVVLQAAIVTLLWVLGRIFS